MGQQALRGEHTPGGLRVQRTSKDRQGRRWSLAATAPCSRSLRATVAQLRPLPTDGEDLLTTSRMCASFNDLRPSGAERITPCFGAVAKW